VLCHLPFGNRGPVPANTAIVQFAMEGVDLIDNVGAPQLITVQLPAQSPAQCPEHGHVHGHPSDHGRQGSAAAASAAKPAVIPHQGLPEFANNGNILVGIATRSQGAQSFEVWRSRVAPGGATPLHTHETEEVFVVLRGSGEVQVGDDVIQFAAPATVIAPAGVPHQLRNTGDVETEQIVIVGVGSTIYDAGGAPMTLPWRK